VSQYQKGKTNLDFTEARDSEWQWHQLGHMQVCISLQLHKRPVHSTQCQQVCVQPPTSAVNVTLPACAAGALLQQSIAISCPPGAQQQTRGSGVRLTGETDGRTDA